MTRALTKEEFLATMDGSMRFVEEDDESVPPVSIGDYFRECSRNEEIVKSPDDVDIHAVYATADCNYSHVLLNWGLKNVYLVIVTKPLEQEIHGHFVLNLDKEYDLRDKYVPN